MPQRPNLTEARRELRLKARHALSHSYAGGGRMEHHDLNIDAFLRELEAFIDAKIKEAIQR